MKRTILFILLMAGIIVAQDRNLSKNIYRLGKSYEAAGKLEKAEEIYTELFTKEPWNEEYFKALNNIYLKEKKYKASINLLQTRLKTHPKDPNIYGLLGTSYYVSGDYSKAFKVWDSAIKAWSDNSSVYRLIANYALENRAFEKAIEILKKGAKRFKSNILFAYDLATLYSMTMKFGEATDEYCKILLRSPSQLSFVKSRISSFLNSHGAFEASIAVVRRYFEDFGKTEFLDLWVFLLTQKKEFSQAFELVKKLDEMLNAGGGRIFAFAENVFREKNYKIATKAFEYLIDNYKDSPFKPKAELRYAESKEHLLAGKIKPVSPFLADFLVSPIRDEKSVKEIIAYYSEVAKSGYGANIKGEALFRIASVYENYLRDFNEAEKFYAKIIKEFPYLNIASRAMLKIALLKIRQGDIESARRKLDELLKKKNISEDIKNKAYYSLAEIRFWQGQFARASDLLKKITKNLSNDEANDALELELLLNVFAKDSLHFAKFARGKYFSVVGKYDSAAKYFDSLATNENLFGLKDIAEYELAKVRLLEGNIPVATKILQDFINKGNTVLFKDKALFLLAQINEYVIKNRREALRFYSLLLEKFPHSLYFETSREKINSLQGF